MRNRLADNSICSTRVNSVCGSVLRTFAAFFVAFSVLLQGYAVQTHIHGLPGGLGAQFVNAAAGAVAVKQSDKTHKPAQPNPDDCPLCQAAFHASAVLLAPPAALLPSLIYFQPAFRPFQQRLYALYPGHDEEQRGPPSL